MKILILSSSLTSGGLQRVASLWTKGFTEKGHNVAMILGCSKNKPYTFSVPAETKIYHVHNLVAFQLYRRLGIEWFFIRHLRRIVQDYRPELIISLHHPWTEWIKSASASMDVPIISTEHTAFELPSSAKMASRTFRQKYELNKQYACVTVLTQADKECLRGSVRNVYVLPNPLAYPTVKSIPSKDNVLLAVGQLHSWHNKGLDVLIEAWGRIASKHPNWVLQIAGLDRNNSKDFLQSIANKYEIDKQIEFVGFQSNMLPIYQRASIFVLSSRYEGFGMALTEAMSQGCACIACDFRGRQAEIITDPSQGILCPPENVQALSDAIEKLIVDKDLRKSLQINGAERSKHYGLESIMSQWDLIINDVFQQVKK